MIRPVNSMSVVSRVPLVEIGSFVTWKMKR